MRNIFEIDDDQIEEGCVGCLFYSIYALALYFIGWLIYG
jgi:hypothetical protein